MDSTGKLVIYVNSVEMVGGNNDQQKKLLSKPNIVQCQCEHL